MPARRSHRVKAAILRAVPPTGTTGEIVVTARIRASGGCVGASPGSRGLPNTASKPALQCGPSLGHCRTKTPYTPVYLVIPGQLIFQGLTDKSLSGFGFPIASKSVARKGVLVQVRPGAPSFSVNGASLLPLGARDFRFFGKLRAIFGVRAESGSRPSLASIRPAWVTMASPPSRHG
jgi:hypothetical protein